MKSLPGILQLGARNTSDRDGMDVMEKQAAQPYPVHDGVRSWLVFVALLVLAMIAVGGGTRLTQSGLSITEWKPLLGAIPPMSQADWVDAFEKYRQIPQYQLVNKGMSLEAFKVIFWWEWAHRFLGRFIGLAFAVPLAIFWWRGMLPSWLKPRLLAILALGAIQGVVGWYMVMSGLVDRVDVSQYRLALHLTLAFVILAALVWTILDLSPLPAGHAAPARAGLATLILVLLFVQIVAGGFVAGTKAGLSYNTWPLMDGRIIPEGLWSMAPWWVNPFENVTTIQFNHRMLAYIIVIAAGWQAIACFGGAHGAPANWLLASLLVQAVLGIWTLLAVEGQIPIGLGVLHQTFAAVVLAIAVWHKHGLSRAT